MLVTNQSRLLYVCAYIGLAACIPSISQPVAGQDSHPATAHKRAAAKPASKQSDLQQQLKLLQEQIDRQAGQIDKLQTGLSDRDAQLKQALQAAADAKEAAARAQQQAQDFTRSATQNQEAVNSLQAAVSTVKSDTSELSSKLRLDEEAVRSKIENPSVLHYRGLTFTPYGFLNGESVYRTHATGGELTTAFSSIPYEHSGSYGLSETFISGRQSRVGVLIENRQSWGIIRAIVEGDFLGVGTTSNNNQSSSYMLRQRIALAEVETRSGWTVSGGQGWSLSAENRTAISTAPTNIAVPQMIDPNYVAGLVWNRGGNLRVTRRFSKVTLAASVENPQILYTASIAGNTPYAVLGSAGVNGGLMNATMSSCTPTTVIVNYTSEQSGAGSVAIPVYKTLNSCSNLANVSFNQAPDVLAKVAFDRGTGHYEIFGVSRFAHETIYPGETNNSYLYGGIKDIVTGAPVVPALNTANTQTNSVILGGAGASARVQLMQRKFTLGLKGIYGPGLGRYGASTLPDVTANSSGAFSPLHNVSALVTAEASVSRRVTLYTYYGGDYAGRSDHGNASTTSLSAPTAVFCPSGSTACTATPNAGQLAAGGTWGPHWGAPSASAVGYGSRMLSNAACLTSSNPGYNGGSTGYYPGASCGAQTRQVQEITAGTWLDIYKGEGSRLRQGFQYSYAMRDAWSGASGIGAKGTENMIFTSFRLILP